MNAIPPAIGVPQPLVQAVPAFDLSPALVDNGGIDYSTQRGVKLYQAAMEKLQDNLFDVDSAGILNFLAALADRSRQFGWRFILEIARDETAPDDELELVNLLTNHSELSVAQIRASCALYINGENRAAQYSRAMYVCLTSSLSNKGKDQLRVWREDYTIDGEPSGPLFLKIIIRESHIDTNATVRHLRAKLTDLTTHLVTLKYDITEFNRYVRDLMDQVSSRGERTTDLIAYLFEAYRSTIDKRFNSYIEMKINAYDDGEDIEVMDPILSAQNKYKVLVDEKRWDIPSKEEEKIIALETQLAKFTKPKGSSQSGTSND
jgi:hypothetical protein